MSKSSLKIAKIGTGREKFVVNVAANMSFFVIQMLVSMWFTPYLIGLLGIGVFGVISLANSVTSYMNILTSGLNTAVVRFLTIDLNRNDAKSANITFNTALFSLMGLIGCLIPLALCFMPFFPVLFDVPPGTEFDSSLLFASTVITFGLSVITGNFAISTFAYSRFVSKNLVEYFSLFVRIGLIVLLFSQFEARLWFVGVGMITSTLVSFAGYGYLWRKLTPHLRVNVQYFDRSKMGPLLGMGWWMVVHKVGDMFLKNIDLIVVNTIFGADAAGGYGALLPLSKMIISIVSSVSDVLRPAILQKYAQEDWAGLRQIAIQANKLLGLLLALPVGGICGFAYPFLSIWLGSSFLYLVPLLIVLMAHLSFNLSMRPLGFVQNAYNKVRIPGIAMIVSGVLNVVISVAIGLWGKWGPVGVAVTGALIWTIKNLIFFPIYTAKIMSIPWYTFLPTLVETVVATAAVGLGGYLLTQLWMPQNWISLLILATVVALVYVILVSLFALDRADWQLFRRLLPRPTH